MAERRGIKKDSLRSELHRRDSGAPRPDGRVSGGIHWERERFEEWMSKRGR